MATIIFVVFCIVYLKPNRLMAAATASSKKLICYLLLLFLPTGGQVGSSRSEIFPLKQQRDIDQANHDRHLDEWSDDGCKCCSGIDSINCYSHSNGQFEIVT